MHTQETKNESKKVTVGKRLKTAAVAVVGAAVLASCGAGGGGGAAAELSEADKTRIAEEFRECMAKHGLDGKVDISAGGLNVSVGALEAGQEPTIEQEQIAEEECEKILELLDTGSQLDPESEAQLIDAAPAIQKCMKDKGYDVTVEADGGIGTDSNSDDDGVDETEYQLAEDACYKENAPDLWEKLGADN